MRGTVRPLDDSTLTVLSGGRKRAPRYHAAVQVIVDRDLCESNALCMEAAPEVFRIGEDDVLEVLDASPDESLRPKVEAAVRACPKMALSLAD